MANSGWDGKLAAMRKANDGEAPSYDVTPLVKPSTVGDQNRMRGWSPLETPVSNGSSGPGSPDSSLRTWQLPTGVTSEKYNTAAETEKSGP